MKNCPYCGASLCPDASYCPHCMTSLIKKREILPYRTVPQRTIFSAVLLLALLSGSVLISFLRNEKEPDHPQDSEVVATASVTTVGTEVTETVFASTTGTQTTHPTDVSTPEETSVAESDFTEDKTTDTAPPTPSPDRSDPTDSPPAEWPANSPTGSVTESPVEITDTHTEEASPSDTEEEPEAPDVPDSGTYSYKGVLWYYQTPTDKTQYPYTFYNYELDEVAIITGVDCTRSDGVYYVPETIYGKHVVMLRPNQDTGARIPFTSSTFKKNAKVIYFPPEVTAISSILLKGTSVTDIYIAGEYFFLNGFPDKGTLTVHCSATCENTTKYLPMKDLCPTYSTDTFTCVWEEWDGSTLYPQ